MSWQWIPGQITGTLGDTDSNHQNAETPEDDFYMPGYYVGKGEDDGKVIVHVNDESISPNKWVILEYPTLKLKATEHWHDGTDNELELTVAVGNGTVVTSSETDPEGPVTYGGKYRFIHGGQTGDTDLVLSYSLTQNTYIICNTHQADALKYGYEPAYSVNELTGGVKGEYFWKPNASVQNINWDTQFPLTFTLAGNVTAATEQDNYVESYDIDLSDNYFKYSRTSDSDDETPPAGEYVNSSTGEKMYVGLRAFKASDNSLWVAANIGKTRDSGSTQSSESEKWYSSSHGGTSHYLGYIPNQHIWQTVHGSKEPYYQVDGAGDTLKDTSSVVLNRYEWDDENEEYVRNSQGDLNLKKGPMANSATTKMILMGDYSQWRM